MYCTELHYRTDPVFPQTMVSPLPLAQLTCILTNCLTSLRFRPDLLLFPPLQTVLPSLLPVISRPQCLPSLASWATATVQCLLLWRELATATHQQDNSLAMAVSGQQIQPGTELAGQAGLGQLLVSALDGLEAATGWAASDARVDTVSCCKVVQCVVLVLPDLSDQETTWHSVNRVLDISIRNQLHSKQELIFSFLANLFSIYCYPADQLLSLTNPITSLSSSPNYQAYLAMLEQAMENLAEVEQEHSHWTEPGMMDKDVDRDSALASSEAESGMEELAKLKISGTDKEMVFEPYLAVLIEKTGLEVELTLHHIERLVTRGNGETRHRLALQVVLPYLAWGLAAASQEEEQQGHLEAVLEILCKLVTQQPTAMALIRNQKVWRQVKTKASAEGTLSRVAQQVIKTIVLNSHKFIKIRLSEAEAMALQDDENDVINFDQRDRNAQFWLFKQLYHVLVQSSIRVLNGDWPRTFSHLVSAWQVSLHLVRTVPDFLVFALERGIVKLNQQLLDIICSREGQKEVEIAEMIGSLVSFLIFLVVSRNSSIPPYLEVGELEESLVKVVLPKLEDLTNKESEIRFRRILLSRVLEGSINSEGGNWTQLSMEDLVEGATDDGYEADQSDNESGGDVGASDGQVAAVVFMPGLKHYTAGLLNLAMDTGQDMQAKLYTLEYLVYRLVRLRLVDQSSLAILNNGFLSNLLGQLFSLAVSTEDDSLVGLASLVLELVNSIAVAHITHNTIKNIFKFLANPNCLRLKFFHSLSDILLARMSDYNLPGISILTHRRRARLSSNLSSDSGLDSNCSASSSSFSLSNSRKYFIKDATEDLERDYTIVMRIKIEVAPSRNDEWVELVTVENRNESLGIHINLEKGLKLTLSNWKGTYAAAETNFQSMFEPGKWIHLVFNVGTVTEGNRSTKTLSAFIDCCRVWDVGLSVDRRANKVRKEKFLCLTVGSGSPNQQPNRQVSEVKTSDVFFLGNCCFTLQDIVMDFLLDSKVLTQPGLIITRVNLRRLGDKISDLSSYCLPLVRSRGGSDRVSTSLLPAGGTLQSFWHVEHQNFLQLERVFCCLDFTPGSVCSWWSGVSSATNSCCHTGWL